MKIVICLDNTSFRKKILATAKSFVGDLKSVEITILHIIDEQLFYATTGYEVQLGEDLETESKELKKLCVHYLGVNIKYISEYGVPKLKIDEMLVQMDYDLLIAGTNSRYGIGERLVGSFAEHILRNSRKPVLIIPLKSDHES